MTYRAGLLALMAILVSACASGPDWRLKAEDEAVAIYYRDHPQSPVPEFKGVVTINASVSDIMQVLTDFERYPEWVHQCKEVTLVEFVSYTEAYIYQVNTLPLIRDRDMILHGKITREGEGANRVTTIALRTAPNYCQENDRDSCPDLMDTPYLRVEEAIGHFQLRQHNDRQVEVTWEQHLDPGGWVPAWAVRLMLADFPQISLNNLKTRVEGNEEK